MVAPASFHWCKERVCFRCIKRSLISQGTGVLRSHVPLNHLRERWNCLLVDESQGTFFSWPALCKTRKAWSPVEGQDWRQTGNCCLWDFQGERVLRCSSWVLSVSGGSTQHFIASFAFETWVMAQVLTHQTHMPEEPPFQKMVCFPALLVCPWHYCQRPGPWAEAVPCSPGMPAADSAFQPFWQQHFPPHQEKTGEEELSYCRTWEIREDFSVSLWFFAKEMWCLSCLAIRLCMNPAFHPPFNSVNAQC